ncbi:hypothetical protein TNCT_632061 [Trichonephila clavata]|uniref:Uncharacterized protein n=1 Tax=Trichonephila clavata TaxID=2740835 RepID=A0A8X6GVW0_TRICU|nr:hypothetical protein TNCT_632061 [Trichonephila clavata]
MDVNAQGLEEHMALDYLKMGDITEMDRPTYSLDCHTIENVWDVLNSQISARKDYSLAPPGIEKYTFR